MSKEFLEPQLEVVYLKHSDIICTSVCNCGTTDDVPNGELEA